MSQIYIGLRERLTRFITSFKASRPSLAEDCDPDSNPTVRSAVRIVNSSSRSTTADRNRICEFLSRLSTSFKNFTLVKFKDLILVKFKNFTGPRIFSTLQVEKRNDVGPNSLHDRSSSWRHERSGTSSCSVYRVDLKELYRRSKAVDQLFYYDYQDPFLQSSNAICAMQPPKGGTNLVVHHHPVRWGSSHVFLFSDCKFLFSVMHRSKMYNDDSFFLWPFVALPETRAGASTSISSEDSSMYSVDTSISSVDTAERSEERLAEPYICTLLTERQTSGSDTVSQLHSDSAVVQVLESREEQSCDWNQSRAGPRIRKIGGREYRNSYPHVFLQQTEYVHYYLCCEGFQPSKVLNMVLEVAKVVGKGDGYVVLNCPWDARDPMEALLLGPQEDPCQERSPCQRTEPPSPLRSSPLPLGEIAGLPLNANEAEFFARRIATLEEYSYLRHLRFVVTRDKLWTLAGIINLFEDVFGSLAVESLFDLLGHCRQSLSSALMCLEGGIISRRRDTGERPIKLRRRVYIDDFACRERPRPLTFDGWSLESLKVTLNQAAGVSSSLEPLDKAENLESAKTPMVIFVGNMPHKVLWHTSGRTIIEREYEIEFTGVGVRVARRSVFMWLVLAVGVGLVLFYGIYRGLTSDVSFEDLLQAALSIAALYAATIIPLVYSLCYSDENMADVASGMVHVDKRSEFRSLSEEEKLYLCLRSVQEGESDRQFIGTENTCYLSGTTAGGPMRVSCMPCIGNLLMMGFKYWEDGDRKGLLSPTREVFELEKVEETPHRYQNVRLGVQQNDSTYRRQLMHAKKAVDQEQMPLPTDCPVEHYYVGFAD